MRTARVSFDVIHMFEMHLCSVCLIRLLCPSSCTSGWVAALQGKIFRICHFSETVQLDCIITFIDRVPLYTVPLAFTCIAYSYSHISSDKQVLVGSFS